MTLLFGMAVLTVRIIFVLISYQLLRHVKWHYLFTENRKYLAGYFLLLLSISLGHLVGSFVITIIELLQNILLSSFI